MSCMPRFGRLWDIDFCNQLFPRRAPAYDDRLFALPAQNPAPSLERVIPAVPSSKLKIYALHWNSANGFGSSTGSCAGGNTGYFAFHTFAIFPVI